MWVGFWVYECVQLVIPVRVAWRVCVGAEHPLEFSRPDAADAYTHILTPNYRHILTYRLSSFHMHTIMNTYCVCIQKGAPGWTVGVIDDGLGKRIAPSPTLIPSCCQRKALSFSVHLESHHTTQCSSLYTTAITQCSHTPPMSIYPSAHSRWRQQWNYSEHDLSMRHELHQFQSGSELIR